MNQPDLNIPKNSSAISDVHSNYYENQCSSIYNINMHPPLLPGWTMAPKRNKQTFLYSLQLPLDGTKYF